MFFFHLLNQVLFSSGLMDILMIVPLEDKSFANITELFPSHHQDPATVQPNNCHQSSPISSSGDNSTSSKKMTPLYLNTKNVAINLGHL